jgi:glutamate--cysteine ligase
METDPDRCGLPSVVFDTGFDMEAWIDWACKVPALFYYRNRNLVPGDGIPFDEILLRAGAKGLTMADWELQLSSIFTDVRSYTYIEVRCADLQPDHLAMAVPALWTGILYHPGALEAALRLGSCIDGHGKWLDAMASASRHGLDGEAGGRPIRELAAEMLRLSGTGLTGGAACAAGPDDPSLPLRLLDQELELQALK